MKERIPAVIMYDDMLMCFFFMFHVISMAYYINSANIWVMKAQETPSDIEASFTNKKENKKKE